MKPKARNKDEMLSKLMILIILVMVTANLFLVIYLLKSIPIEVSFPHPDALASKQENKFVLSVNRTNVAEIYIPAVDNDGRGVMAKLHVEVRAGSGRSLVNVDNLLFWTDTQHSIRMARRVAERYLNTSLDGVDIIYTVEANATLIEGTSAGAALTVATIAAVEGRKINQRITITGAINSDGSIGPVGAVLEKARAAKENGFETILVPLGQSYQVRYEPKKYCEKYGLVTFCETEYVPRKIAVGGEIGIRVVEIGNIAEALDYLMEKGNNNN